jgi:Holliday junction resolvase-like predicted endonuclease
VGRRLSREILRTQWLRDYCSQLALPRGRTRYCRNHGDTGAIIAVVEVKARATNSYGSPFEAVTQVKQKKLRIATTKFLSAHHELRGEIRFDVVAVLGTQLDVLHNAF